MSSTWGNNIKISIFGESHGEAIGAVIDGLPAGETISIEEIQKYMLRRAPGFDNTSTKRKEADIPKILSGLLNGTTTGAPICAIIENTNINSKDYSEIENLLRPGHADYTAGIKHRGFNDKRGGGHFSGRLTAPLTFAGGLCKQILEKRDISLASHVYSIGNINDIPFCPINITNEEIKKLNSMRFAVINPDAEGAMREEIKRVQEEGDSIGGIIECAIIGIPPGLGDPIFNGIENNISQVVFGIPAVKGIEFGSGFNCKDMHGSQHNDEFIISKGNIITKTNNHGGILGGISSGMPIIFRVAIKPTPSILIEQKTVNIKTGKEGKILVSGRHDPCIVPRAVVAVESAAALAIADLMF